jgi:PPOX class probable F420-dependent enzyme
MDERVQQFLTRHRSAVMVTLKPDGTPHVARIVVGVVDGKLWSSGTRTRTRTKYVRHDLRATLCVLNDTNPYEWLGLETTVQILDDADAPQRNLALYRTVVGEPDDLDTYLRAMVNEQRLIYEFSINRAYGQY